ncbi:hypothetical protein [Oceanihabitans sp. 2_MG-2023]|uniref:hypothetical protein n=1 Tax=Oceanihabitans sp. 2_MG-2023 TaxID=3062661 RepID=UPI0026E1B35D|nr:hypothetical protein [Oceanihabitans sp. 2_MG-2023]
MKKTSSEAILEEELQTFNWRDVDVYPTFKTCSTSSNQESKKVCFQNTLTEAIYKNLTSQKIVVTQDIQDTILVHFQISETGELHLMDAKIDSITLVEIPNIEDLLYESLDFLPEIYPAIKRGQQVKTQFTLPIQIQVD